MFTPEVPKHPACLSIWLESLFEHIDYRVTVVKNDPRNRKKEKNGAPQNWFFSASMSLHLFEWLSRSSPFLEKIWLEWLFTTSSGGT